MPVRKLRKGLFVVKLSGSVFFSSEFEKFVSTIKRILRQDAKLTLVLVAGGGGTARRYIAAAERVGADQATLDEIGIEASRLNAMVLAAALRGYSFESVPTTLNEIVEALELAKRRVVVTGGLHPGQSTNAVAALIAEKTGAERFINATDVDGVYTKDPRMFKGAKKLPEVTTQELSKILGSESMKAGGYNLMDPIALKLIERSKIPTTLLKCDSNILEAALTKKGRHGTRIISDS